jgi:hypothetical protein
MLNESAFASKKVPVVIVVAVAVLFEIMIFDVPVYVRLVFTAVFQTVPDPVIVILPVPNAITRPELPLEAKLVQVRE